MQLHWRHRTDTAVQWSPTGWSSGTGRRYSLLKWASIHLRRSHNSIIESCRFYYCDTLYWYNTFSVCSAYNQKANWHCDIGISCFECGLYFEIKKSTIISKGWTLLNITYDLDPANLLHVECWDDIAWQHSQTAQEADQVNKYIVVLNNV